MDDGLSHLHILNVLFLASVFSVVAVLILLAAFVYLLRRRSACSFLLPKFSGEPRQSPSNLRLFFLRVKGTSSQVEPAGADEAKLGECCDMGPSLAAGDGVVEGREFQQTYSHARLLFTIKEEKETESESEDESFRFVRVSPSQSALEAVVTLMAPATARRDKMGTAASSRRALRRRRLRFGRSMLSRIRPAKRKTRRRRRRMWA